MNLDYEAGLGTNIAFGYMSSRWKLHFLTTKLTFWKEAYVNFMTYLLERRSTLRSTDCLVFIWVE